jgi:glycosyltransferase involved in cell wall biosynthesis
MKRRILFVESATEMGGVEYSTLYLALHLDPKYWAVTVLCPGEGSLASTCREKGLHVEIEPLPAFASISSRIGSSNLRFPNPIAWLRNAGYGLVAVMHLRKALARSRPDLVVTKGLYAHFTAGAAAKLAGVRCIWHVQDLVSKGPGGLYRGIFSLAASILPDVIAVDGTSIARQLPDHVRQKVHVVLNGVDVKTFHPCIDSQPVREDLGIPADAVVIGHAARITPWKGQHHLLEAFGRIAFKHPGTCLLLVGSALFDTDSYERHLRQRAGELGLNGRVIFTGFRRDLPQVLNAMDIFAYPSVEKDTSPLALISALACGLPVAAFDIDGVREVLEGTGLLVPVRDEQRLAEVLARLLSDPELRKCQAAASREQAVQRFSLEQYAGGMEKIFELGLA